ncbi:MAG: TIGR02710 family CRISPR-associated CARF protein [Ignavibacterium sp.]|jgi:CRISPR-associated protein (TIGR02710 family)|nr:TIGR02710 family CRISPR-associated CARF protein [Ignavibacterium sp.]
MIENNSKKVLIMTVGTGASGSDVAHGLFFSIKDSNPAILILIGSSKSFETTLPHLKNMINAENINLEIVENLIEEVNDLENLHFQYSDIIKKLLKQGYSLNKICVDYTSGTKAMSAALVSAAIENKVGSLSYVYGDRGDGGRVKSGTERRNSFSPNKFYSKNIFDKAVELFNIYRFNSCIELLEKHEFHPEYQGKSELLIKLSKMFDAWDKFNFSYAWEISNNILVENLKEFDLKNRFEKYYKPFLRELKEKNLSYEKIFELIQNSDRRAKEGKFDDAVARLYRTLEMIGQIEFEKVFNCSTSDVRIENIPTEFADEINAKYLDSKDNKIKLPLFATFDLLNKHNNPLGIKFFENIENIKKVLQLRNNSILAHGMKSLDGKLYSEASELVNLFFSEIEKPHYVKEFPEIK